VVGRFERCAARAARDRAVFDLLGVSWMRRGPGWQAQFGGLGDEALVVVAVAGGAGVFDAALGGQGVNRFPPGPSGAQEAISCRTSDKCHVG